MKAIRAHKFGGPEVLQLDEVPDPAPGPGQVLVRIRAAGVNPVDTYIRAGSQPQLPQLPYIPGGDTAGVVETVGEGVRRFQRGDRVWVARQGGYAELAACDASMVQPLPPSLSFGQGAAVGVPYATAYRALHAHAVLDHTAPDYLARAVELSEGRGTDVILEMLANVNLQKDLDIVARFGRIVIIGNRGTIEINPRGTMSKDATIAGLALWNASPADLTAIMAALTAGLANGTLRPVVGREFPLAQAADAHQAVLEPGAYGKIVLVP